MADILKPEVLPVLILVDIILANVYNNNNGGIPP
jgi:hypothetical protein